MRISKEQIRAARALLGWTQQNLGEKVGVIKDTISRIEGGSISGSVSTLDGIYDAFEQAGIEFLDYNGVRLKPSIVQIVENYMEVLDDIARTVTSGDTVMFHCADDRRSSTQVRDKLATMRKEGIRFHSTICEGNDYTDGPPSDYRQIDAAYFASAEVSAIYGSKYVVHIPGKDKLFIMVDNADFADVMKQQFEYWWKKGEKIGG